MAVSYESALSHQSATIVDIIKMLDVKRIISSLSPNIESYVNRNAWLASVIKTVSIGDVGKQITGQLKVDYDNMMTLLSAGLGDNVGSLFSTLYETLNGTNVLLGSYLGIIQRTGIEPYVNRWVNSTIQPNIPDARTAWFMHNFGVLDDASYKKYMAENGWSDDLRAKLEMVWINPSPLGMILDLKRREYIPIETAKGWVKLHGIDDFTASQLLSLAEQAPEPYRLADFAAKGLLSDNDLRKYFNWYGLGTPWDWIWRDSQYILPSASALFEMRWRGLIDDAKLDLGLKRTPIHKDFVDPLKGLLEQIPPAGDLVTMVVREAFEAAYVVEAPTVFAAEMAKKGYTKAWSDRYWTAHFLPMPVEYAYDNLRRGYWSKEQFLELLRIADIHPKWREDIYNVAFNPPSIREMGYGYDVQAYTLEDIVMYRRWGGLSEEDAKKAAQAMVAYRTEAERNVIRRDVVQLYVLGKINLEELRNYLVYVNTRPEVITLWIDHATLQKQIKESDVSVTEPRTLTRSDIQWLFENGLRNEEWMRNSLKTLGYEPDSINAYVDQSKKRMADKIKPVVPPEPRKLTLAMIQNLLKLNLLDKDEATAEVIKLGYTKEDAALIIQIMLIRVYEEPEVRELTDAHVTSLYDYNLVSESDILAHFKARGYSDADARLLTQLAVITKNLPDLKDMYSRGWINSTQLFEGVKALGIPMEAVEPAEYPKLSKLIEVIGLPDEKAKRIMLTIVKAEEPTRTMAERDLTKAEIVKGVKVGVISPVEGVSLLQSLGYDENESWYILAINKVVSAGDPEGYWEMRRVTELAKKSRGQPFVDIPEELVTLERERRNAISNINKLKAQKATEEELGAAAVALANVESRMHTITAKLKLT